MKLSLPPKLVEKLVCVPKLVEKLVCVPVISFCKIFIPSFAFAALLCRETGCSRPLISLVRVLCQSQYQAYTSVEWVLGLVG
jgi:hypothetical protein